jgi:Icc-related predicted phosphoesterase
MTRIFFATDVHGSEKCWLKAVNAGRFYRVDCVILGGDLTGKAIFPIVRQKDGTYRCNYMGQELIIKRQEELEEIEKYVRILGYYPYRTDVEGLTELSTSAAKRQEVFRKLMIETLRRWLKIADEKLEGTNVKIFVTPGNDDDFIIDSVFEESKRVINVGDKVIYLDDAHEMLSCGWTNPTPWHTPRECSEEELAKKIDALASLVKNMNNCIFNLHAPPWGSGLDEAPILDENLKPIQAGMARASVGSKAVLEAIKKYQPLLALHGHIHESRGSQKIGQTLCLNPGSDYADGRLTGYLIELDSKGIRSYQPTSG